MNTYPQRRLAAEFDQGQVPTIACVNMANTPLGVDWDHLIAALDEYANAVFAPVWGTPAKIIDGGRGPNIPAGCWGILFLDDADAANALGYHDLTPDGLPLSKVFVRTTLENRQKVSVTAAHQLAEMLVNPGLQLWAVGPDAWYPYEITDAVERDEFDVKGVAVSNFVYPAWFEAFRAPNSAKFDHLDTCKRPFEIRPGGYMPVYRNGRWGQLFGSQEAERSFDLANHPRMQAHPGLIQRLQMRHVQQQLRELGFYNGRIDGEPGPLTMKALRHFQDEFGLMAQTIMAASGGDFEGINSRNRLAAGAGDNEGISSRIVRAAGAGDYEDSNHRNRNAWAAVAGDPEGINRPNVFDSGFERPIAGAADYESTHTRDAGEDEGEGEFAQEVRPSFFFALEGEGARCDEVLWGKAFDLVFCYDVLPGDAIAGVKGERLQSLLRHTKVDLHLNVSPCGGLTLTDGVAGRLVRFEDGKIVGDPPRFQLMAPEKHANARLEPCGVHIIFTISGSMIYSFFLDIRLVDQFATGPRATKILDLDLEGIAGVKVEEPRVAQVYIFKKDSAWEVHWRIGEEISKPERTSLTSSQLNEEYIEAKIFDDLNGIAGDSIWKNIDEKLELPAQQDFQDLAQTCLRTAVMAGAKLYARFSKDSVFKRAFNMIDSLPDGSRISIITDEIVFPWELFYPLNSEEGFPPKDIYPNRFWGRRFLMEWLLVGDSGQEKLPAVRQQMGKMRVSMGLNSGIDGEWEGRPLLPVQLQKTYCETSLKGRGEYFDQLDDIKNILGTPHPASLIYFFCHGTAHHLRFDKSGDLTADYARGTDYPGWPIVFINACAAGNPSPLSFYSFRTKFRERKAAGIIAPYFSIPTLFAAVFAKTLIARYADHQPIGPALFELRRELLAKNNPLGLWYSLQCPLDVKAPEQ